MKVQSKTPIKPITSQVRELYQQTRINKEGKLLTASQAIRQARLDWTVEEKPIFFKSSPTAYRQIAGRFTTANVRKDTRQALGVVGDRYQIIQNQDMFSFFDEVVKSKEATYIGAGSFMGGRLVWLQARLPKNTLLFNDVVEKHITLVSSHDGSMPLSIVPVGMRIACTNQLPFIKKTRELAIRHTLGFKSKTSIARHTLGLALKFFDDFETNIKTFANTPLDERKANNYFNHVLNIENDEQTSQQKLNQRTQLFHLFEKGRGNDQPKVRHTLWAAYNAVTEYADHFATQRVEDPLRNAWMGVGADLKLKAYEMAVAK